MNTDWYQDALSSSLEVPQGERIPVVVYEQPKAAAERVAQEIAQLIRDRAEQNLLAVLGLATGTTSVFIYRELVRMHREEGLSFYNVATFNLDEYHPMMGSHPRSYHRFMSQQLFDQVDIDPANIHLPEGSIPANFVPNFCEEYEQMIAEVGGIDFQLLGIGRTGHIAFNEPGSTEDSRTRLVNLDRITRQDAAKDFPNKDLVPHMAITMGVGTILEARRIVLIAFGEPKAPIVARAIEGDMTSDVPATFLQLHPNCLMVLDQAAANRLTRMQVDGQVE